jgi:SP family general alpha glucoside:H+ symporter-like MFS transporter
MATPDMDKDIETNKEPAGLIAAASIDDIQAEAAIAADEEHGRGFWASVKLYPAAVGWSLFFSLGVVMCENTWCL